MRLFRNRFMLDFICCLVLLALAGVIYKLVRYVLRANTVSFRNNRLTLVFFSQSIA